MAKFVFKRDQIIGYAPAEQDQYFLDQCFVDTGALNILCDCNDQRRLLVGRAGAGKSALIAQLEKEKENVIILRPESLALTYISNSNVIKFFLEAGVKLDIFYRLLWRHIFVVEILKSHFRIENEEKKKTFLEKLWAVTPKKKRHEQALEYLKNWGGSFWEETEYRIQEVTSTLEKQLKGAVEGKVQGLVGLSASAAKTLTEEQKSEVVSRAQEVVNKVQIRELSDIIDFLADVLMQDSKKEYFIAIDKLDEDWVEDSLRFRLIRALIETSLDFARIKNVKIIIALRNDLIDRVFRYTRDAGFQEEKYRTSMFQLSWSKQELTQILDTRIGVLVREKYTKSTVSHQDLLPSKVGNQNTLDYILARTHMRPRDVIQFFNTCIIHADGKTNITQKILKDAEGVYSRERLRALADEWYGVYPNLMQLSRLLRGRKEAFKLVEISLSEFENNYLELLISGQAVDGLDKSYMDLFLDGGIDAEDYRRNIVHIFYKTGLIGLKTDETMIYSWSDNVVGGISKSEIDENTKIRVHPAYWRTFGTIGHTP